MIRTDEAIDVTVRMALALAALDIDYLVGGSVASSIHGRPRTTEDVDMVAHIAGKHIQPFVVALKSDFYVDADMIADAIRRRASFNVIHLATMVKVDLFVFDGSELAMEEMSRRVVVPLRGARVWFASPEDIIIQKLDWYRRGNRISERQWKDVLGVISVQADRLDIDYLRRWAAVMKLTALLDEALAAVAPAA